MGPLNTITRYFDLFSRCRTTNVEALSEGDDDKAPSNWWLLAIYLALLAGIFAKGLLEDFAKETPEPWNWGRIVTAIILSITSFPGVYKTAMEESGPGFVQLCVIFTAGIGVKTVVDTPQIN